MSQFQPGDDMPGNSPSMTLTKLFSFILFGGNNVDLECFLFGHYFCNYHILFPTASYKIQVAIMHKEQ